MDKKENLANDIKKWLNARDKEYQDIQEEFRELQIKSL